MLVYAELFPLFICHQQLAESTFNISCISNMTLLIA